MRKYKIVSEKQCYVHDGISRLRVGRGRNVNLIGFWLLEQRDQGMDQLRDYLMLRLYSGKNLNITLNLVHVIHNLGLQQ